MSYAWKNKKCELNFGRQTWNKETTVMTEEWTGVRCADKLQPVLLK